MFDFKTLKLEKLVDEQLKEKFVFLETVFGPKDSLYISAVYKSAL